MYCVHCGTALPDYAKFCRNCGKAVEVDDSKIPKTSEQTDSHHSVTLEEVVQKAVVIDYSKEMDNELGKPTKEDTMQVDAPSQINPDAQLEELKEDGTKNHIAIIICMLGAIFGGILSASDQEGLSIESIFIMILSLLFLTAFIIRTFLKS